MDGTTQATGPQEIAAIWIGVPSNLNAATGYPGSIFFFQGSGYYEVDPQLYT